MMTYRISRNICIQHEEIFDLLVNYSTLHYIKILWIYKILVPKQIEALKVYYIITLL